MKLNHMLGAHEEHLLHALMMMTSALEMLDQVGGCHDVGAHLDLAISRLSDVLEMPWPRESAALRGGSPN